MERNKLEIVIIKARLEQLTLQLKDKEADAEKARNIQQQVVGQFFLIQNMITEEEKKLKKLEEEKIPKGSDK